MITAAPDLSISLKGLRDNKIERERSCAAHQELYQDQVPSKPKQRPYFQEIMLAEIQACLSFTIFQFHNMNVHWR